ncbi:hypothetical protein E4K10_30725 [Streptomyces sp. T1317-0309]|nr:hypothetical protein E4K10_30725 [Streptomyces sp. T1317-0309]
MELCDTAADGTVTGFLRHLVYTDGTGTPTTVKDTALDAVTPYTTAGTVGVCAGSDEPPCAIQRIFEQCRCDDTDGDGVADTDYVELLGVDCEGALSPLGRICRT